jgi:hypothetical protein
MACVLGCTKRPTGAEEDASAGRTHTFGARDGGSVQTVEVGDRMRIELPDSPRNPADPDDAYAWGDARIDGDAVVLVGKTTRTPPPDVDGGHVTSVYDLRTVEPGTAKLTIDLSHRGAEASADPYVLELQVTTPSRATR